MEMSIAQTVDPRFLRSQRHEHAFGIGKPCGHAQHVGTCPSCQHTQLARWRMQPAQASRNAR
jgi:hypothetical protein